jgi:hypothetical protein
MVHTVNFILVERLGTGIFPADANKIAGTALCMTNRNISTQPGSLSIIHPPTQRRGRVWLAGNTFGRENSNVNGHPQI